MLNNFSNWKKEQLKKRTQQTMWARKSRPQQTPFRFPRVLPAIHTLKSLDLLSVWRRSQQTTSSNPSLPVVMYKYINVGVSIWIYLKIINVLLPPSKSSEFFFLIFVRQPTRGSGNVFHRVFAKCFKEPQHRVSVSHSSVFLGYPQRVPGW